MQLKTVTFFSFFNAFPVTLLRSAELLSSTSSSARTAVPASVRRRKLQLQRCRIITLYGPHTGRPSSWLAAKPSKICPGHINTLEPLIVLHDDIIFIITKNELIIVLGSGIFVMKIMQIILVILTYKHIYIYV